MELVTGCASCIIQLVLIRFPSPHR